MISTYIQGINFDEISFEFLEIYESRVGARKYDFVRKLSQNLKKKIDMSYY